MVCRYSIRACSCCDLASLRFPRRAPPVKMGWLRFAPYDHIAAWELINAENALLRPKAPPPEPVKEIWGKNCALATPISAFAATRTCSALRMSGRARLKSRAFSTFEVGISSYLWELPGPRDLNLGSGGVNALRGKQQTSLMKKRPVELTFSLLISYRGNPLC